MEEPEAECKTVEVELAPAGVEQAGREDLNDPTRWINVQNARPPVDVEWFQKRLDKICGTNSTGQSILRIVWGCDRRTTSQIIFGESRLRYRFYSKRFLNGDVLDLGVPRFILEELNERGQAFRSWERQRYYATEDNKHILDALGPYPEDGYYTYCWLVAHHEGGGLEHGPCCDRLWEATRRRCWGEYRDPAACDLEAVERGWRRQQEHRRERPDEPLPARVLTEAQAASFESYQDWSADLKARSSDMIDDFMKTHSFSFTTDDPVVHKWGRFHFMNGHSKSGSKN